MWVFIFEILKRPLAYWRSSRRSLRSQWSWQVYKLWGSWSGNWLYSDCSTRRVLNWLKQVRNRWSGYFALKINTSPEPLLPPGSFPFSARRWTFGESGYHGVGLWVVSGCRCPGGKIWKRGKGQRWHWPVKTNCVPSVWRRPRTYRLGRCEPARARGQRGTLGRDPGVKHHRPTAQ